MKYNKLWLLIIPAVLIALVLFGIAGYMLLGSNAQNQYAELLSVADEAYQQGDYNAAIAAYEKAIELDRNNIEAYRGIMGVYVELGQPEMAQKIMDEYTALTQDTTLQTQYSPTLEALLQQNQGNENTQIEAEGLAAGEKEPTTQVSLNESLLSFISGATHQDFVQSYGEAFVERTENGEVVRYASAPFLCDFRPKDGTVLVDNSGMPFSTSKPTAVSLTDLSALLVGMTESVSLDVIQAEPSLSAAVLINVSNGYLIQITVNNCKIQIACDENGVVSGTDAWNEITVTQIPEEVGRCDVSGSVVDATTGEGVDNVTLRFREGFGNTTGEVVEEIISDDYGSYKIDLDSGDYTVEVVAEGYIIEFFDITIHSWFLSDELSFTISPELKAGEIRIVLEWDATPRDLDSYLFGTSSDGQRVRVCFTDMNMDGVASLDVDCMNGYGPETMTIYDVGGTYQFVVADYNLTGTMAMMGATVKIYMPGESQPTIVDICSSAENDWLVCTISDGKLYVENTPYNGSSSVTIKAG